ncbi:GGDEF domain-containing protein [Marinomonas sp.]|nr:diguanylate cyclase [Marinomonas sp.]MDB4837855.1 GGDEF domain-containing protein [Marinomonas sp.]
MAELPRSKSKAENRVVVSELIIELNTISKEISREINNEYDSTISEVTNNLLSIVHEYNLEVSESLHIKESLLQKAEQLDEIYLIHVNKEQIAPSIKEKIHHLYLESRSLPEINTSFLFKRSAQKISTLTQEFLQQKIISESFYNIIEGPEQGIIAMLYKRNNIATNLSVLNTQTSIFVEQLISMSLAQVIDLQDKITNATLELKIKSAYYATFITSIVLLVTLFTLMMMIYFHKKITTRLVNIANNLTTNDSQENLEKEVNGISEISLIARSIIRYKANNKKQRDKIASSVEQLKFIIEHSSQAVLIYRKENIIYSNNSGQGVLDIDKSLTNHIIPRHLLKAIDDQTYIERLPLRDSYFKFYATDIDWDGVPSRLALMIDITSEVVKEKQLMENLKAATDKSSIDAMTGLYNRHKLDNFIKQSREQEYAIILTDIDWFKAFNDFYGHAEGDTCIIKVSDALKESLRSQNDLAIRYGGEEFLIILMDSTLAQAEEIAQRIQSHITEYKIPHEKSDFEFVTLSLGIAHSSESSGENAWHELFEIADRRLYQAKKEGRAKTVSKE